MRFNGFLLVGFCLSLSVLAGCPWLEAPSVAGNWEARFDLDGETIVEYYIFDPSGIFVWEDETGEYSGEGTYVQFGRVVIGSESYDDGVTVELNVMLDASGQQFSGRLQQWYLGEIDLDVEITGTRLPEF
jgi:hypothetical protein